MLNKLKHHGIFLRGAAMFAWLGIDDAMIASGLMLVVYAICGGGAND